MKFLLEGIRMGLILCFLIGPIFFMLLQTGIERGFRAGTVLGLGIWMSDLTFILLFYSGISQISQLMQGDGFSWYVGVVGSIILGTFGVFALVTKPAMTSGTELHLRPSASYFSLWLKGFFINVINPPTTLFWFTIVSTAALNVNFNNENATYFFGGIIGTLITTDLIKILLAKRIRHFLRPSHILWLRRISGIALILFGVVLLIRTLYFNLSGVH